MGRDDGISFGEYIYVSSILPVCASFVNIYSVLLHAFCHFLLRLRINLLKNYEIS